MLGLLVIQIFVVSLLRGVGGEETGAFSVLAPDGGTIGGEQLLELRVEAAGVCGEIEQSISFLGQLLGELGDFTGDPAVVGVVELGDATVCGGARGGQAQAQALCDLADSRRMAAKDADPPLAIPAADAVLEVEGQVILGAHGEAYVLVGWRGRRGEGEGERRRAMGDGRRVKSDE